MKTIGRVIVFLSLWVLAPAMPGQTSNHHLDRMSVSAMDDMGKVKLLAERGNFRAQLKLAAACMDNRLYADALKWYSAAAEQGQREARYQRGHLLLFGCQGATPEQSVAPNPVEGLRLTYQSATNHNAEASFDMGLALKDGMGCAADPMAAYAWFSLCAEAGNPTSQRLMNELALHLSTEDISKALSRAREMKTGHWQALPPPPTNAPAATVVNLNLKLSGVVYSPRGNMAIINNRTLSEGETSQFLTEQKETVTVTCQHIQPGSVEVQVGGEAQPRTLLPTAH